MRHSLLRQSYHHQRSSKNIPWQSLQIILLSFSDGEHGFHSQCICRMPCHIYHSPLYSSMLSIPKLYLIHQLCLSHSHCLQSKSSHIQCCCSPNELPLSYSVPSILYEVKFLTLNHCSSCALICCFLFELIVPNFSK